MGVTNGASAAAGIPDATSSGLPGSRDGSSQAAPSATGDQSAFGSADEEVMRLTHNENMNYYSVLKVEPANLGPLKRNYFKLSRLVHPDKCQHPDAGKAMAVVSTAYDVLSTPMKKKLYDAYATEEKPADMSYAEWEAKQVEVPAWLVKVLKIPGGGCCLIIILIITIIVLVPLFIIMAILAQVFWILCLPVRLALWCCGVKTGCGSGPDKPPVAYGINPTTGRPADDNV